MVAPACVRLADQTGVAVPPQPGAAHRARTDHRPHRAGQTVVGDSEAVRLAAGALAGAAVGANIAAVPGRGILFELATGVLDIQYDYIYGFSFYTAHYFGAWVFIAAFLLHVGIKLPRMRTSLRSRSLRSELHTSWETTLPEPPDPDGLVAAEPGPATMSRRGVLALVGGGSLLVAVMALGQTIGGAARPLSFLLPRGRDMGEGPNDFEINRTASAAGIKATETGVR